MRKLNNITAKLCFALAFVTAICIISGARHLIVIAVIALVLGFAHLADNQKTSKS